jgi:tRNA-uridine 2-sulfurtransferase
MKRKILVAMSGGVDSSVAAALLKEQGHEVAGATIRTWASDSCADLNTKACCGLSGVEDARDVADTLGIPYWVFNFEAEFKKHVVDYFASEYLKGRTPNPCVACNEHIKFRLFLSRARQLGYDSIATGHYAQLHYSAEQDSVCITEGRDASKDQSYVLFPLDREILKNLFLPIGGFTKSEIRARAKELGLGVASKPDSQEICFIPSNDYGAFLKREKLEGQPKVGVIRNKEGKVLGEHEGFFNYTRGQRRGLGVAHTERLYVISTSAETNEVVVGKKEDVLDQVCEVGRVNWFLRPEKFPIRAQVKIRSQHEKAHATLESDGDESVRVLFDIPQDAITPGQGAVFYDGSRVIGGGWIDRVKLKV